MRPVRFSLSTKSNVTRPPPQNAPKRKTTTKKSLKPKPFEKTSVMDPIPLPVIERLSENSISAMLEGEEEEEEINEYSDDMDSLAGLTRNELLKLYRIEYNNYLNNLDKVSSIIEEKITAV
ncbi:hypothetical protein TVAG_029030 [Trichomonas vaginalis G3]|uniref:Uncharacterized protein n=1 Tax=Trichomonas vaginalis (strain ATCC PRA-98 / G3) TaxID=412133 RepID=A2F4Z5_TRIV3|nr:hypothetical protein TVAGG3_0594490 [Trichomonas vaginalis G3]EAX99998.1 hypothetical protein TVAG_029030 [Trichomonas vaginalis G3]KAI5523502.1 hypothetical protein TVAGG3_0594490 [Trichomonas vaginalis G3]|eukprot:XP_001312928.1 hypothetical protein [Trichomonas vaginalis G3]